MNVSNGRLPGGSLLSRTWQLCALVALTCLLAACGGGSSESPVTEPTPVAACSPGDPATVSECGTLLLGLTDADGDFLSYVVNVKSLQLTKANGTTVETLPSTTRLDFAQYVDLTEFVTAASVPPGTYVAGSITLDYSDAEVFVELNGAAEAAMVVDAAGNPLTETTLDIVLSNRDRLVIARGLPSLLTVDFDLAASHAVDVAQTPVIATADPVIIAEIDPVDSKDIRIRGVFIEADEDAMTYTVALRPFHHRFGDYGRFTVHIDKDTEFEVNGELWTGVEGLRSLNAAGTGTLTVAQGTLNVSEREFTAAVVLAGSSVPGADMDAAKGNVIARSGDKLVVRGATVVLQDERAFFRDDVVVTIGPDTKVSKRGHDELLDTSAISVGQAVTVRGTVTVNDELGIEIDATQGAVRMHLTHLSGIANTVNPGQIDVKLQSIDRRRVDIFDFTGTGPSPDLDADPSNYEVATGSLPLDNQAVGKPVVAFGFPSAFGTAPPDFEGRTVIDFSDVRSVLGVGWGSAGTTAPFLSMDGEGLLLDHLNEDIDQRHHIKQGPVLIDLTALNSGTLIIPPGDRRSVFALKRGDSLHLYRDFADFSAALTEALDGSTTARSMYARGHYDAGSNIFTAWKIAVILTGGSD